MFLLLMFIFLVVQHYKVNKVDCTRCAKLRCLAVFGHFYSVYLFRTGDDGLHPNVSCLSCAVGNTW